jgi:hypothetical protein
LHSHKNEQLNNLRQYEEPSDRAIKHKICTNPTFQRLIAV